MARLRRLFDHFDTAPKDGALVATELATLLKQVRDLPQSPVISCDLP